MKKLQREKRDDVPVFILFRNERECLINNNNNNKTEREEKWFRSFKLIGDVKKTDDIRSASETTIVRNITVKRLVQDHEWALENLSC